MASCSDQNQDEERLLWVSSLFSGSDQHQKFNRVYELFPTSNLAPSNNPSSFEIESMIELPNSFVYESRSVDVNEYLDRTDVSALLILKDGKIRYEN